VKWRTELTEDKQQQTPSPQALHRACNDLEIALGKSIIATLSIKKSYVFVSGMNDSALRSAAKYYVFA
jgi:hypothetical protein